MDTENLIKLSQLLPPECIDPCQCHLCVEANQGHRPDDSPTMLLTAIELRTALINMPDHSPVIVEVYEGDTRRLALVRSVYRDSQAPVLVLLATEPNDEVQVYV